MSVIEYAQMSKLDPEDEDGLVLQGIKAIASTAGTYLVTAKEGLKVHCPMGHKSSGLNGKDDEFLYLNHGQKIQIVNYENFTATLPQGEGYIKVEDHSQLVKSKCFVSWSGVQSRTHTY